MADGINSDRQQVLCARRYQNYGFDFLEQFRVHSFARKEPRSGVWRPWATHAADTPENPVHGPEIRAAVDAPATDYAAAAQYRFTVASDNPN